MKWDARKRSEPLNIISVLALLIDVKRGSEKKARKVTQKPANERKEEELKGK